MNAVLIGMPGCGKTAVGEELKKLNIEVYDTDSEIVKAHGEISEIFKNFGEEYFRELETRTVKDLSLKDGIVIATGGGLVLRAQNVELLKRSGKLIYLRTKLKTLLTRLSGDKSRPLISGDTETKLTYIFNARTPIYSSCADVVLDTDGCTPYELAQKITEYLI